MVVIQLCDPLLQNRFHYIDLFLLREDAGLIRKKFMICSLFSPLIFVHGAYNENMLVRR